MARIIPNANTWVGFKSTLSGTPVAPKVADITGAVNLTPFVISLNASAQGNTVPTPSFDSLFETSIIGTSQATFTGDFYRDNATDTAWTTLERGTFGYIIVSRYGGSGSVNQPSAIGDECEVWPISVTSRTMANMANNAVMTFTVTCAVNVVPAEDAVVVA
jgi:hypothetical protein